MGWAKTPEAVDFYDKFSQLFISKPTTIMFFFYFMSDSDVRQISVC